MEKKILILGVFASGWGGSRGVCEDLAEQLARRGWQVITATSRRGKLARIFDMASTILSRRREYALAQLDLFGSAAFWWALLNGLLLYALSKPFVLTLHGGMLPNFAQKYPRSVRWLINKAAAVTAPSNYLAAALSDFRSDICIIPNGINLAAYSHRTRLKPQPELIWVRAFHSIYNPVMAVQVLAEISRQFPGARLTMMGADKGDGSLAETRRMAQKLGVLEQVSFAEAVAKSEIPGWLDSADIFLNTTNQDNTPVSVIEAMACGLCIVSTNAGGLPHLLDHGTTALLSSTRDPLAMAANVLTILNQPELAAKLSSQARSRAESFDWSSVVDRWEQLLISVVKQQANHG